MDRTIIKISIIVPFYKGNKYMYRLFNSINRAAQAVINKAELEVVLVDDSPEVKVLLPDNINDCIGVNIYYNDHNVGIQKTRINGVRRAQGEWIIFLDQDDELVVDGFERQICMASRADVVVGNGLYQYGSKKKTIYKNIHTMEYLIQKENFIEIRNLIPSPGECLVRKSAIPEFWLSSPLKCNGADDWFLWILLFQEKRIFRCNENYTYIHNDSDGQNLSLNLESMYHSALEMCEVLKNHLTKDEFKKLKNAIHFKYRQDSGKLNFWDIFIYKKCIFNNLMYKANLKVKTAKLRGD